MTPSGERAANAALQFAAFVEPQVRRLEPGGGYAILCQHGTGHLCNIINGRRLGGYRERSALRLKVEKST